MEINEFVKKGKINAFNHLHLAPFLDSEHPSLAKVLNVYNDVLVYDYIFSKTSCEEKRIKDSLKLVALPFEVLSKKMHVLSRSELLKVELSILLIRNVDMIVVYQFDSYFMEKELFYFKKLFKKLVSKYGKTIVLLDSKIDFMIDLVDRIVVCNSKNELEVFVNPTFYEERLLELLEIPKIVEFVNYVNHCGKKIGKYTDIKELIKAIYREV